MIDYRHFDQAGIEPRYEFGFGLSYTTFDASSLRIDLASDRAVSQCPADEKIQPGGNPDLYTVLANVSVKVENTGDVDGAAVPQLYVSLPSDTTPEGTPVTVLRGFEKVPLKAGESKEVEFPLTRRDLSYWDIFAQEWALPAGGQPTVMVGWSSRDLPLQDTLAWTVSN